MKGEIIEVHEWNAIILPYGIELPTDRVFMFYKALQQTTKAWHEIEVGMRVEFIPIEDPPRGYRAIEVKVL